SNGGVNHLRQDAARASLDDGRSHEARPKEPLQGSKPEEHKTNGMNKTTNSWVNDRHLRQPITTTTPKCSFILVFFPMRSRSVVIVNLAYPSRVRHVGPIVLVEAGGVSARFSAVP